MYFRNIDELDESSFASVLLAISSETWSQGHADKLSEFMKILVEAEFPVPAQAEVNVASNLEWFEQHGRDLETFLGDRYEGMCGEDICGSGAGTALLSMGGVLIAVFATLFF